MSPDEIEDFRKRHDADLRRYARQHFRPKDRASADYALADDAVDAVYDDLKTVEPDDPLPYAKRCIKNKSIDLRRRHKREQSFRRGRPVDKGSTSTSPSSADAPDGADARCDTPHVDEAGEDDAPDDSDIEGDLNLDRAYDAHEDEASRARERGARDDPFERSAREEALERIRRRYRRRRHRLSERHRRIIEEGLWRTDRDEAARALNSAPGGIDELRRQARKSLAEALGMDDISSENAEIFSRLWKGEIMLVASLLARAVRNALSRLPADQADQFLRDLATALKTSSLAESADEREAREGRHRHAWESVRTDLAGVLWIPDIEFPLFQRAVAEVVLGAGIMPVTRAFVVRTTDRDTGTPARGVYEELRRGFARIGWSYSDGLDLRRLLHRMEAGQPLGSDERDARRCLRFLTEVEPGHILIYPQQPERGMFTIVGVTGTYDYLPGSRSLEGDFRSFHPCVLVGDSPIRIHDGTVPAQLRFRLQRQGRFSEIYDIEPLRRTLACLASAEPSREGDGTSRRLGRITEDLCRVVPDLVRREWSQHDFTRLFCRELFEKMGLETTVQEGPGEMGSDVLVTVSHPLLLDEYVVGVQAFAYEGDVSPVALRLKLDQLLQGWDTNGLDQGVLMTTGLCGNAATRVIREHNDADPVHRIRLIAGRELTELFLRHLYA